jgi:hypothetical protein
MKKLPLGMQDFKRINTEGFLYIDKTEYIYQLVNGSPNNFISRPRRFGKSLMISTLKYLFRGDKEAFAGTWIYDKWDFKPCPVIDLSMASLICDTPETIEKSLVFKMRQIYRENDIVMEEKHPQLLFADLILKISQKGRVVVLIDEYDRPILKHLGNPEMAHKIRDMMRDFYIVLKDYESNLHFVMLTGLTKITKAGVFSTMNHLTEWTSAEEMSCMLGCTEEELLADFGDYIEKGMQKLNMSKNEIIDAIRKKYNGFSFDGIHSVYNPYSILCLFNEYKFKNYWIDTGMSDSLAQYAKGHELRPEKYLHSYLPESKLVAYEIEKAPPESFLVQSGFLTFKGADPVLGYFLDYPNEEVKDSFSQLIMMYSYNISDSINSELRQKIVLSLRERDFDPVFEAMNQTFAAIPGKLWPDKNAAYQEKEAYFHTVILTLFWSCGLRVTPEEWTSKGLSDLVLELNKDIYIIELKKAPPSVSIQQIKDKGYAVKYASADYVALVGIEIDPEKKTLIQKEIAVVQKNA